MERYPTSEEKHGGQKRSRALWRKMLSRREGFQRTSDEGGQQGRPHWQWELELTFSLVRDPRCWERLKTGREGDDTGWDGGVASPTPWTWAWASSGRWGRTGKPGLPAVYTVTKSRTRMSDWTKKKKTRDEIISEHYFLSKLRKESSYFEDFWQAFLHPPIQCWVASAWQR